MRRRIIMVAFTLVLSMFSYITYSKKVAVLQEIKNPKTMAVDTTQLYVTERSTVYIYSLADFKLIKKFGREGQGPQEFRTLSHKPISIDVSTDRIIVSSIRRISYFTKLGDFIKEVKAVRYVLGLQRLDNNRFLGWEQATYDGIVYGVINIYDAKLDKLKEIYRVKNSFQGPGQGYKMLPKAFVFQAYDNKILLPGKDDATIDGFDGEMKKMFSIHLDQEKQKITQKFKEQIIHNLKTRPETKNVYAYIKPILFPGYFPVIANFFVDHGTVYVMTWKKEESGNEFFTYDMKGKFKKRLMIPIRYESELSPYPSTISKGKLYQLVENENKEVWEFHVSVIK